MNLSRQITIEENILQMIFSFMNQNSVSAKEMEFALNKVMLGLKDQIITDLIVENQTLEENEKEGDDDNAEY